MWPQETQRRRLNDVDPIEDSELDAGDTFDTAGAFRIYMEPWETASVLDPSLPVVATRPEHLSDVPLGGSRPNMTATPWD